MNGREKHGWVQSLSDRAGWNLFLLLLLGNSEIALEGFLYIFREAWHSFRCKVVDSFRMKTHKRGGTPTWACEDLLPIGEKTAVKEEFRYTNCRIPVWGFGGYRRTLGHRTAAFGLRPGGCRLCPAAPCGPACLAFSRDGANTVPGWVPLAPVSKIMSPLLGWENLPAL